MVISRVTQTCRGNSTVGDTLPTSVTDPPLRAERMARSTVGAIPTASKTQSAPRPSVNSMIFFCASGLPESTESVAPSFRARSSLPAAIINGDDLFAGRRGEEIAQ